MTDLLTSWLADLEPPRGLTPSQQRVAQVVSNHQQLASYSEIAEIADRAMVNASTVVRYAKALGYSGWPDLQQELRVRYLAGLTTEQTLEEHSASQDSPLHGAIRRDIANLQQTLGSIDALEGEAVIEALAQAKSIVVVGMGTMSAPAMVLAHLGSVIGYPITFQGSGGPHLAASLNRLATGDVLVVANVWRPMREIVLAAETARRAGAVVVALTDMRRGTLAKLADHALIIPSEGVSFFTSVTAATSVVYGLVSGMEAAHSERSRAVLRRTQDVWHELATFTD